MEKISFKKQLFYAMNAKVLVGPYGAGLINSFWQSRNSNIIEIKPNNDHFANCFFSAAFVFETLLVSNKFFFCFSDTFT